MSSYSRAPSTPSRPSRRDGIASRLTRRPDISVSPDLNRWVTQVFLSALSDTSGPGARQEYGRSPLHTHTHTLSSKRFTSLEAAQLFGTGEWGLFFLCVCVYPFPVCRASSGYCFPRLRARQRRVKATASSLTGCW